MAYYPTHDEMSSLGFIQGLDEDGYELIYLIKGPGCTLTLDDDDGRAVVTEWLPDGVHAWTTCENHEDLCHTVKHAFEVLAEGRSKTPQLF